MKKKILLSGIQPSGAPHIGNYFGMMKQLVDMQDQYETYGMIVNYHALTTVTDGVLLRDNTYNVVLDFLAIGLDPEKMTLFKQSDVPEHTELTWIFNCLITMPWLARAHAFKDKTERGLEANVGLFDYPVLMAADMLMYDSEIVPVGKDQKQHVEMAREIAMKFNNLYGETFTMPQEFIKEEVAIVPGTDGQKMSKSYGNTIPLFGTDEELKKAVMSIVTDSKTPEETKDPETCNIFALHKLVTPEPELTEIRNKYTAGGMGYKESKDRLLANLITFITPMRTRREQFASDPLYIEKVLENGAIKAKAKAIAKMNDVRIKVGLI